MSEAERRSAGLSEADLLAAVVASSDDAIISKTADGVVTSWNAAAERIFGYRAEEMIGQPIAILAMPGQEDEMPAILRRLAQGERVEHFETARRRRDGSTVLVSLTVSPILDKDGNLIGASKIARDITAARRLTEDLQRAEERVRRQQQELLHAARLAELGSLSATLAHEIAQPLGAISLHLGAVRRWLAVDGPSARPMIEEGVDKAAGQAARAVEIVRRLRAFTRPADGTKSAQPILDILEDAVAIAALDASFRGVLVVLEGGSHRSLVNADRIEIEQVALNLIINAMHAMEGREPRRLRLSAQTAGDMIEVTVADTGCGLAPEIRDRLFDSFFTTKADGVGLGLSICRSIVESHGGRLWADNNADGGATFRFTLKAA